MLSKPRRRYFSASSPAARHNAPVASIVRYVGHLASKSRFVAANFAGVSPRSRRSRQEPPAFRRRPRQTWSPRSRLARAAERDRSQPPRRTASPGCWCPDTESSAIPEHHRRDSFTRDSHGLFGANRLATVPVCLSFCDKLMGPIHCGRRLNRVDDGYRAAVLRHQQSRAKWHHVSGDGSGVSSAREYQQCPCRTSIQVATILA